MSQQNILFLYHGAMDKQLGALLPAELRPGAWTGIQGLHDPVPSTHISSPSVPTLPSSWHITGPIFQGPIQQHFFCEVFPAYLPLLLESTSSHVLLQS